jgi:hypothetical protein
LSNDGRNNVSRGLAFVHDPLGDDIMKASLLSAFGGFALAAPLVGQTPAATTSTAVPAGSACKAPEHRQFDFWVGDWDVFPTGSSTQVATSLIEKLYRGCAIRENWMPKSGQEGGSLNGYDARDRIWRQTWLDSSGAHVVFEGGLAGNAMVLTGMWRDANDPGKDALTRMTYTRGGDGSVRQLGEQSLDSGKTWQPSFDFTYKPRPAAIPAK